MMKVVISAHFPGIKPAHHAFVETTGEGSSWATATCDAVRRLARSDQLRGKRAKSIMPGRLTINIVDKTEEKYG